MKSKQIFTMSMILTCCLVSLANCFRTLGVDDPDVLLTAGMKIDAFDSVMKHFGFSETMEDIRTFENNRELRMWDIHEGVLIVSYSVDAKAVSGMSYFLSEENNKRGKGSEVSFLFAVKEFRPKTRELKLVLKEVRK